MTAALDHSRLRRAAFGGLMLVAIAAPDVLAQQATSARPAAPRTRAESLFVSADPADHPQRDHEADIREKAETDSIYAARSKGVMKF